MDKSREGSEQPYEVLLGELNQLVGRIERDETGIDELTGAVNRAYDIVALLRARVARTEELLAEVIAVRQAPNGSTESSAAESASPSRSGVPDVPRGQKSDDDEE